MQHYATVITLANATDVRKIKYNPTGMIYRRMDYMGRERDEQMTYQLVIFTLSN